MNEKARAYTGYQRLSSAKKKQKISKVLTSVKNTHTERNTMNMTKK